MPNTGKIISSNNILEILKTKNLNNFSKNIKSAKSNYKWSKFVLELEKFISNL